MWDRLALREFSKAHTKSMIRHDLSKAARQAVKEKVPITNIITLTTSAGAYM